MTVRDIITEITDDIVDVIDTKFTYQPTTIVPNSDDSGLTFERGVYKLGKVLETCVLYVDIRNSVGLTEKHSAEMIAKMYTAFIKAVIKAGRHHGASTRNIIGDRVMLVFPAINCFHNAVECAITINHIAKEIINQIFSQIDFKCGIGIDYGRLKVIKVGIQRNGTEKSENKGLVWTGHPANLASRLTDHANKSMELTSYKLNYNPKRYPLTEAYRSIKTYAGMMLPAARTINSHGMGLNGFSNSGGNSFCIGTSDSKPAIDEVWTESQFAQAIELDDNRQLQFKNGTLNTLERVVEKIHYPPILFTERVMNGLQLQRSAILNDGWKRQPGKIPDISVKVYGGYFTWRF